MKHTSGPWEFDALIPDLVVDGPDNKFTGLLDKDGNKIYRTPPPIGFGRDKEW